MRLLYACLFACAFAACSRKVEVSTGPTPAQAETTLHVTNNLSQAVNVYVVNNGTDMLLNRVAANSTADLPVRGFTSGSSVELRATTADGTRSFSRNVVLSGNTRFEVP